MKAKLLALSLSAIYKSRILGAGTTTLEPLNIACENGKVEVD